MQKRLLKVINSMLQLLLPLAKVHRDKLMLAYDEKYPEYGFASHKGYGTAFHSKRIHSFGLSPIHRKSFKVPEV